jgi:hypothetical protein
MGDRGQGNGERTSDGMERVVRMACQRGGVDEIRSKKRCLQNM